ncbi:MAG: hypothetical protein RBS49_00270 [Sphaerochaeta sp.]|jgi:hypothetical protein|nr:hypothetical protein [Sphaerochaeta sp.]MDX9914295.1 hypothetical protein [Sphaerochaeta sp.]
MGQKGFFRTVLSSVLAAVLSFFIIYFFIPGMGMQYLGVSFSLRDGSVNAQVMEMVGDVEFSKENAQHFWKLLNSREFRLQFKAATEQGEQAVKGVVQSLVERVR